METALAPRAAPGSEAVNILAISFIEIEAPEGIEKVEIEAPQGVVL